MRFARDLADDLLIERHTARRTGDIGQQPVVIPFAPAKPMTIQVKCYPRNEHKVQPV